LTKAGVILENDPWIIGLAHVALLHNSSVGYSRQVYHERVLLVNATDCTARVGIVFACVVGTTTPVTATR